MIVIRIFISAIGNIKCNLKSNETITQTKIVDKQT